jgi:hypothetical protein
MSTILSCPACSNPLRVPDDLLGQKVRCPTCSDTFQTPTPGSAPGTNDRGAKAEDRKDANPSAAENAGAGWKELPLEMSPGEAPKSPPPDKAPGLVGAVELKLSLDDDGPAPGPPEAPPDSPAPGRPRPPRLADADDDLKPCPSCGKSLHHDARQCPQCGEDLSDHRPRSPFRRDAVRRDAEPHRGGTVLTLGIISLCLTATGCGAPIGLALGLTAWFMGQNDLRKIRAGLMDRDGEGTTQSGWVCGIIGTCLNGLMSLCCVGYFVMLGYAINSTPPVRPWTPPTVKQAPAQPFPPPPPMWKDKK